MVDIGLVRVAVWFLSALWAIDGRFTCNAFVIGTSTMSAFDQRLGRQALPSQTLRGGLSTTSFAAKTDNSESDTLSLFSPCKINLFLRIIRKRPDGFHDLASLFQAIGFGDRLELSLLDEKATEDEFSCNMKGVPTDSSNLVLRALQLMREKTGKTRYFKANLIKQVPAQAGLGGGSANAATAMFGANQLLGEPATLDQVRSKRTHVAIPIDPCQRYSTSSFFCLSFYRWLNGRVTWAVILPSF